MASGAVSQPNITMEQLLKEAMLLHKNTVKELVDTKEKFEKLQLSKKSIVDKAKAIQRECNQLKQENIHLKVVQETLKGRSDESGCKTCQCMQQSMDSLTDAYTKTIEEKDRTIRMLEQRLAEKSELTDKVGYGGDRKSRTSLEVSKGTSPDTTTVNNDCMKRRSVEREPECCQLDGGQQTTEEVSPGSRRTILKLPKDRQKRNRYQEAPAPVVKSPSKAPGDTSRKAVLQDNGNNIETSSNNKKTEGDKNYIENPFMTEQGLSDVDSPHKSAKRPRVSEGDGSFLSQVDSAGKSFRSRKVRKKSPVHPEIIVPETMAVDYFDEFDGVDCSDHEADTNLDRTVSMNCVTNNPPKLVEHSEKFSLGPPNACSTQILNKPCSKFSKFSMSQKLNLAVTQNEPADMDCTVIGTVSAASKSAKLSRDVTRVDLNTLDLEEDKGPGSPVFIGVQKTELRPIDIKSPSLFDDDDQKMAEREEDIEDSESPFLLRQPISLGKLSDVTEEASDGELQSPSLLHHKAQTSSNVNQSKTVRATFKPSCSQSETWSQKRLRRSNRGKNGNSSGKSSCEFKQTTLTQTFDWSERQQLKERTIEAETGPSLQEIQNIESRLSPQSLARLNRECDNNVVDEVENCYPPNEFKKPEQVSPASKAAKANSSFKTKHKAASLKKVTTDLSKQCPEFDPDETVPPEILRASLQRGDNYCESQLKRPMASLADNHNVSLDPAVQLSLDYPDTLAHTENLTSPDAKEKRKTIHMKKGEMKETCDEESQALPSSSKSFRFIPSHETRGIPLGKGQDECPKDNKVSPDGIQGRDGTKGASPENKPGSKMDSSLNCSYDRVPKKKSIGYAYVDVVRKKDERQKLKAYFCQECEDYFKDVGLSEEERASRMQKCSRHRARYVPPSTPEHFWSIGFPDTPECEERGYIRKDPQVGPSRYRRKRGLQKRFKGKTEEEEDYSNEKKTEPVADLNTSDLIFDL